MTSILSTISQHFGKALILGTFLPTLVFVLFGLVILLPLLPSDLALIGQVQVIAKLDTKDLVLLSVITIVLSGLIYNLNIPIMRLFEGYPWRESNVGQRLTLYYQAKLDSLRAREQGMRVVRDILQSDPANNNVAEFGARLDRVSQRIINEFPSNRTSVLPTRFGNVIRSFEDYPRRQYGISAITIWPRLIAKIDKDYAATIDDSKVGLDFMMNGSALSGLFTLLLVIVGLVYRSPLNNRRSIVIWLIEIAAFALLSHLMYRGSINRAAAYGGKIKASFDLYRWDLLKQLGYSRTPTRVAEEHALWENISKFLIYGAPPKQSARLADYNAATTATDGTSTMMIDTVRGVSSPASATGEITIKITVTNLSSKRSAKALVVTDSLPAGYEYVWNSAVVDQGTVKVAGSNPYRFTFDELPAGTSRTLEYRALLLKKP